MKLILGFLGLFVGAQAATITVIGSPKTVPSATIAPTTSKTISRSDLGINCDKVNCNQLSIRIKCEYSVPNCAELVTVSAPGWNIYPVDPTTGKATVQVDQTTGPKYFHLTCDTTCASLGDLTITNGTCPTKSKR